MWRAPGVPGDQIGKPAGQRRAEIEQLAKGLGIHAGEDLLTFVHMVAAQVLQRCEGVSRLQVCLSLITT